MNAPFTITRRVQFAETDMAGIVHFANYYRYMEEAEHEFFRSLGLSIMQETEDGAIISWPRVSAACRYESPGYYGELLEIRLAVTRISEKSLTIEYGFYRGETRIAHGEMKTVCCLFRHGEPMTSIPIPPDYREKLDPFQNHAPHEAS